MRRESQSNQSLMKLLGAAAVGAVAMYLSDPERGRRRRAVATDKVRSLASRTGNAIDIASRDFGNRWQGLRAQASQLFSRRRGALVDDEVLMARIRKELGRVVSHPRAIKVTVQQGYATLHGSVLAHEKQHLLDCVRAVAGVSSIEDHLEAHETNEHVPSLQGEGRTHSVRAAVPHETWSPALRAVATIGGGALGYYGVTRRTPASVIAAVIGLGLLTRSATNKPLNQLAGQGQALDLHRSIHIAASPEQVFDVWSKVENFPQFMSNVQDVRDLGDGRTHWVVRGPAGTQVEWDAITTESVRPELLAWSSTPDSAVQQTGMVRFDPDGDGTKVTVHMSYSPPAGVAGRAAASLFNGNRKRQIEQDLARMKSHIESGVPSASSLHAATPSQQPGATLH